MKQTEDFNIIEGCRKNKRKAQEQLYRKYYSYALATCISYVNNEYEAVEIMNDAFMKAFKNLAKNTEVQHFKSWFRRILVNTAIDYHRKNNKFKYAEDIEEANEVNVSENVEDQLSAEEIMELVQKLPDTYRIVFVLYVIEGYSHKEIAAELGIADSTSRAHLTAANKKLRQLISNSIRDYA